MCVPEDLALSLRGCVLSRVIFSYLHILSSYTQSCIICRVIDKKLS